MFKSTIQAFSEARKLNGFVLNSVELSFSATWKYFLAAQKALSFTA
jgi:hypothetical protein